MGGKGFGCGFSRLIITRVGYCFLLSEVSKSFFVLADLSSLSLVKGPFKGTEAHKASW